MGYPLELGNHDAIEQLLMDTVYRKGFDNIVAEVRFAGVFSSINAIDYVDIANLIHRVTGFDITDKDREHDQVIHTKRYPSKRSVGFKFFQIRINFILTLFECFLDKK